SSGTRLSEQPIIRKCGDWPSSVRLKNSGSWASISLAQARLLAMRVLKDSTDASGLQGRRREADEPQVDVALSGALLEVGDHLEHVGVEPLRAPRVEFDARALGQRLEHG